MSSTVPAGGQPLAGWALKGQSEVPKRLVSVSPIVKMQTNLPMYSLFCNLYLYSFSLARVIEYWWCILKYIYILTNSNNNKGSYLLVTYSKPGSEPSALHMLFHLGLKTMSQRGNASALCGRGSQDLWERQRWARLSWDSDVAAGGDADTTWWSWNWWAKPREISALASWGQDRGDQNNRKLFPHGSGGQQCEIQASPELIPLGAPGRDCPRTLFQQPWVSPGWRRAIPPCLCLHSHLLCVLLSLPRTLIGFRAHCCPVRRHPHPYLGYTCKDVISQWGHI